MKRRVIVVFVLTAAALNSGLLQAGNPADINNNLVVNTEDLQIFFAAWLSNDSPTAGWNPACDIAEPADGYIDILDLGVIYVNWLWQGVFEPNEFVSIEAGTYSMGDHHDGVWISSPVHTVTLDSFYISPYEITNRQYCDYLNLAYDANEIKVDGGIVYAKDDSSNSFPYCDLQSYDVDSQIIFSGSNFTVNTKGAINMSDHPMVEVNWYGCVGYCNRMSSVAGLESCYNLSTWVCDFSKDGFRLPTEAEWEYAARGGEQSPYFRYPWGDSVYGTACNYYLSGDPYETGAWPWTTPVGFYDGGQIFGGDDMANGYGLYDVAGNVYEWCNDWYFSIYYGSSPSNNPTGPASGSTRILRGGFWSSVGYDCRVAKRTYDNPDSRSSSYGFRVVVLGAH